MGGGGGGPPGPPPPPLGTSLPTTQPNYRSQRIPTGPVPGRPQMVRTGRPPPAARVETPGAHQNLVPRTSRLAPHLSPHQSLAPRQASLLLPVRVYNVHTRTPGCGAPEKSRARPPELADYVPTPLTVTNIVTATNCYRHPRGRLV